MNNSWALADPAAPGADLGAGHRGLLWGRVFKPRMLLGTRGSYSWELENTLGSQCRRASWYEGCSAAPGHPMLHTHRASAPWHLCTLPPIGTIPAARVSWALRYGYNTMPLHPSSWSVSSSLLQKGWAPSNTSSSAPSLHGDKSPSQAVLTQAEGPAQVTPEGGKPPWRGWWHCKPAAHRLGRSPAPSAGALDVARW